MYDVTSAGSSGGHRHSHRPPSDTPTLTVAIERCHELLDEQPRIFRLRLEARDHRVRPDVLEALVERQEEPDDHVVHVDRILEVECLVVALAERRRQIVFVILAGARARRVELCVVELAQLVEHRDAELAVELAWSTGGVTASGYWRHGIAE